MTSILSAIKAHLLNVLAIIIAFLAPVHALILTVGAAIMADTALGIFKARRKKEKITSRKLSQVVSKMGLYQTALIGFFCIEKYILQDFVLLFTGIELFVTKIVACVLIYIEVRSINEHWLTLTGVSIWDKSKEMLLRAKSLKDEVKDLKED